MAILTAWSLRFQLDAFLLRAAGHVQLTFVRVGHSISAAHRREHPRTTLRAFASGLAAGAIHNALRAKRAVLAFTGS